MKVLRLPMSVAGLEVRLFLGSFDRLRMRGGCCEG